MQEKLTKATAPLSVRDFRLIFDWFPADFRLISGWFSADSTHSRWLSIICGCWASRRFIQWCYFLSIFTEVFLNNDDFWLKKLDFAFKTMNLYLKTTKNDKVVGVSTPNLYCRPANFCRKCRDNGELPLLQAARPSDFDVSKNDDFSLTTRNFVSKTENLCIKNQQSCIQNDEFCQEHLSSLQYHDERTYHPSYPNAYHPLVVNAVGKLQRLEHAATDHVFGRNFIRIVGVCVRNDEFCI